MYKGITEKWRRAGSAALAALILAVSPAAAGLVRAVAEEAVSAPAAASPARLAAVTEAQALAEMGLTAPEWEEISSRAPAREALLTEEALKAAEPEAVLEKEEGRAWMLQGGRSLGPVRNLKDALAAAARLVPLMGGAPGTELTLSLRLDMPGRSTWVFRQRLEGMDLPGSTLKLVTEAGGRVIAAFSSLEPELPKTEDPEAGPEEFTGESPEDPEAVSAEVESPESLFGRMETGLWRGTALDEEGREVPLEIPVMRDPETGKCHLGDPERGIAVADFAALMYGEHPRLELLAQDESEGWDQELLITYANMIRVWDYYAAKGWTGPDGAGTPMLLLQGMCYEDGTPIDNAAYMGLSEGWQLFCFGGDVPFGRAVDVLAHEYIHCATTATMDDNYYEGDWGAINEAMSDILGNLCEMRLGATDDTRWLLGEKVGLPIRAMADPHLCGQPEYVWDIYYAPGADQPNEVNDQGGVHANSSLLSAVAARLCLEGGMTLEEAERLWLTVACSMTATTDYPRMATLLRWALEVSGNGKYREALEARLAETRMESREIAETLPEDRMRLSLQLPDTEAMQDPNWLLTIYQVNTEKLGTLLLSALDLAASLLDDSRAPQNSLFSEHTSWVSGGENRMEAVVMRQPSLCLLFNLDPETEELRGLSLLAGGEWVDLLPAQEGEEDLLSLAFRLLPALPKLLAFPEDGGPSLELPSAGLEALTLPDPDSVG